jgi:hypothetical protein
MSLCYSAIPISGGMDTYATASIAGGDDAPRSFAPPGLRVRRIEHADPERFGCERMLAERYALVFGAHLTRFMPSLLTLSDNAGEVLAIMGLREAGGERLFVEDYLDEPAEQAAARVLATPVPRQTLVEVGNLAVFGEGKGRAIVAAATRSLIESGYRHVIFAATRELRAVFARLGLSALTVAPASPERLGARAQDWGRYYDTEPMVLCGSLLPGLQRLQQAGW